MARCGGSVRSMAPVVCTSKSPIDRPRQRPGRQRSQAQESARAPEGSKSARAVFCISSTYKVVASLCSSSPPLVNHHHHHYHNILLSSCKLPTQHTHNHSPLFHITDTPTSDTSTRTHPPTHLHPPATPPGTPSLHPFTPLPPTPLCQHALFPLSRLTQPPPA